MGGTIDRKPVIIGSTAIDNATKLIAGETIPQSIPEEVSLITKDHAQ